MLYELIDSGEGLKLERFGPHILIRPCPQALWKKGRPDAWKEVDAQFSRETKGGWSYTKQLPRDWISSVGGVKFKIAPTDFGHLGVFPEHAKLWEDLRFLCKEGQPSILNLFAYSGGASLAFAQEGAKVCHLDASKGMVDWARENATLNRLEKAPIRWIVDDAIKFLKRELRRDVRYDAILLDPPTFGRGSSGEVFQIEEDLVPLLELCRSLLSDKPRFLVLSCHTPGVTPVALKNVVSQLFPGVRVETGEMMLTSKGALPIPSGSYIKVLYA
jgi:23S rRNA (cytosine1962-C5)-methyltransferase